VSIERNTILPASITLSLIWRVWMMCAENWALQWTPEAEIAIVEAVLLGETIELAVAFKFKQRLEKCASVAEASTVVREDQRISMKNTLERQLSGIPMGLWLELHDRR